MQKIPRRDQVLRYYFSSDADTVQPKDQPTSTVTKDGTKYIIRRILDQEPHNDGTILYRILCYSFGEEEDKL